MRRPLAQTLFVTAALALASLPALASPTAASLQVVQGVDAGQPGLWVSAPSTGSAGASPPSRYFVPESKVTTTTRRTLLDSRVLRTEQEKRVLDQVVEKDLGVPVISSRTEEQRAISDHTAISRGQRVELEHVRITLVRVITRTTPYTVRRYEDYETRFITTARNVYKLHTTLAWPDPVTGRTVTLTRDSVSAPIVEQGESAWVKGRSVLSQGKGQKVSRTRKVLSRRDEDRVLP